jgi:hypothetical protein
MRLLIILSTFLMVATVAGQIYEYRTSNGHITYLDSPPLNIPVNSSNKLSPTNFFYMPQAPSQKNRQTDNNRHSISLESANSSASISLELFLLLPRDQQTFWNPHEILIKLKVIPELSFGQAFQITLDGRVQGPATTKTEFMINNISRGAHRLQAQVLGSNNKVLVSSQPVTIYVHIRH